MRDHTLLSREFSRTRYGAPSWPQGRPATNQKADRKNSGGGEKLAGRISGRKECRRKIDRRESVGVEVVPFDKIAG